MALLVGALVGSAGVSGFSTSFSDLDIDEGGEWLSSIPKEVTVTVLAIAAIASLLAIGYMIFAGNIFAVGGSRIFLDGFRGVQWKFTDLFSGFNKSTYWRNVGAMALMTLFILLGFFCFMIPGIIVAYGLAQVTYILAENDRLSPMEAVRASWELMRGKKWDLFVFHLSFLGWILLTVLTLGAVGIFYSNPYMELATAGYYDALISMEQGAAPVGNEGI
jgi:uncharacterized membrane protein